MDAKQNNTVYTQLRTDARKNTFTLAMGSVVIVIIMIFVAIRPAVTSVIKQFASNKERQELVVQQEKKLQVLKKLIDDQNQFSTEIELFNEVYPNGDDAEFLVENIYRYFEDNLDLKLVSLGFDYQNTNLTFGNIPTIKTLTLDISFYCDIDQGVGFIDYLETFPRIISIKDVSFSANEDTDNSLLPLTGFVKLIIFENPEIINNN